MGVRGRVITDVVTRVDKRGVGFVFSNCHFILILLVVGNSVRDVEYVRRI